MVRRFLAMNLNQGDEWKTLISRYIGTIPVSGEESWDAEQRTSVAPPKPDSTAMIANVGVAASDSHRTVLGEVAAVPSVISRW